MWMALTSLADWRAMPAAFAQLCPSSLEDVSCFGRVQMFILASAPSGVSGSQPASWIWVSSLCLVQQHSFSNKVFEGARVRQSCPDSVYCHRSRRRCSRRSRCRLHQVDQHLSATLQISNSNNGQLVGPGRLRQGTSELKHSSSTSNNVDLV